MDMDTATFLHMVERFADQDRGVTQAEVTIALMVASIDVLGKVPPAKLAQDFDKIETIARQVVHIAEAEGFFVMTEEI